MNSYSLLHDLLDEENLDLVIDILTQDANKQLEVFKAEGYEKVNSLHMLAMAWRDMSDDKIKKIETILGMLSKYPGFDVAINELSEPQHYPRSPLFMVLTYLRDEKFTEKLLNLWQSYGAKMLHKSKECSHIAWMNLLLESVVNPFTLAKLCPTFDADDLLTLDSSKCTSVGKLLALQNTSKDLLEQKLSFVIDKLGKDIVKDMINVDSPSNALKLILDEAEMIVNYGGFEALYDRIRLALSLGADPNQKLARCQNRSFLDTLQLIKDEKIRVARDLNKLDANWVSSVLKIVDEFNMPQLSKLKI